MKARRKPRLAVHKLASCDGCQLTLLDCEDELIALSGAIEIAYFVEATRAVLRGPYDVALIEGSITTAHDRERIREVRESCRYLVTIGACASAGGVQALRNARDLDALSAAVYPSPQYLDVLADSTPVSDHVQVDYELRGCPIDKRQLLEVLMAFLAGRRPQIPHHSVCVECKGQGHVCVLVAHGTACLGPVTHAGCGALCPGVARGCYGCFGPMEDPRTGPLGDRFVALGVPGEATARSYRTFHAASPAFARAAEACDSRSESSRSERSTKEREP